jgi:hypothetical protein
MDFNDIGLANINIVVFNIVVLSMYFPAKSRILRKECGMNLEESKGGNFYM